MSLQIANDTLLMLHNKNLPSTIVGVDPLANVSNEGPITRYMLSDVITAQVPNEIGGGNAVYHRNLKA